MDDDPARAWRCPRCRGTLAADAGSLVCGTCSARYPVVSGIPDLRGDRPCAIDREADTREARGLAVEAETLPLEALIRRALASRSPGEWTPARLDLRTRQSLEAPARMRVDLRGWLRPCREVPGPVLDVGCGFGSLMVAAVEEGIGVAGVDASLVNLLVARRVLAEGGYRVPLAAALAEDLPLPDASVSAVVALDVVEHVADPARLLAETARVTREGGTVLLSTPNRFSLAAEPHVGVWGVGWLPRAWQAAYVRSRTGITYSWVRLLSAREVGRLAQGAGLSSDVRAGAVPPEEMAAFGARRRRLAHLYNRLVGWRALRLPVRAIAPFFHVVARKPGRTRPGAV